MTKEMLNDLVPSRHVADKLWTSLANETRGLYIKRTSKSIREALNTETTGAVFVAHAMAHPFEPVAWHTTLAEENERAVEDNYEEMIESALHVFGDFPPSFEGVSSEVTDATSTQTIEKAGIITMTKQPKDRRADSRFDDDRIMNDSETIEYETNAVEEEAAINIQALENQLRMPSTEADKEKLKRANDLMNGWGV